MKFSGKNFQPWPAFELDIQGLTILIGPSNEGKCLAKGTPVFMYDGTIKNVEDVQVSDLLMGPDSKPRRVLSLAHGWDEMYDIIPKKGDRWRCNSRHILPLKFNGKKLQGKCPSYRHPIEIEVRDLVCRGKWFRNSARLQRSSAITFPCNREVFNPYFVGLWLGDGSTNLHSLAITTADQEVLDYLNKVADKFNLRLRRNGKKGNKASTWVFSGGRKWVAPKRGHSQNALLSKFRSLGLVVDGEKRLSWEYKTASSRDRMLLLAGLLDSDGHLEGQKQFEFVSKLKALADDAAFIARSLGFRASVKPSKKEDQNGRGGVYFRVRIAGELTSIPTRIQRKQAKHDSSKNPLTTGFHATSAGWGEYFGFELDGDGLFLLGDFTIAHNSSLYRALQGIIRNELDVAYIRDPKDEPLELTLEHDGHTVVASRAKRGSVTYRIGEDKFSKLDGDIPEIVKKFNLGEIKIGDFTFDPIFASQNRPQFLIDNKTYKPSEINAILGAFGGTEKLEAGKKQANLLKTQKDGEARVLAAQIRNSEERKAKLEKMSAKAHELAEELQALESAARHLEIESYWLVECAARCLRLEPLQRIVEALILPDTTGVERLQQLALHAERAAFAYTFARWMNKPLQAIEAATEKWNGIYALWKQIKALAETATLIESQFDTGDLATFRTEIPVIELTRLQSSITFLENAAALRKELKETAGKLAEIDEQLSAAQSDLVGTQKALHDAAVEAERGRAEELMSKGLCPKCGRSLKHACQ